MSRRKHVAGRKTSTREPARRQADENRWWRRLSTVGGRAKVAVVGTVGLVATLAAIPGAYGWLHDQARDLVGEDPLVAEGRANPAVITAVYWATDDIVTGSTTRDVLEAIKSGGAQMGTSGHTVTLNSNRAGRIDVVGITAVVERRERPLAGTAFLADPQGGDSDALLVRVPLDAGGDEIPARVQRGGGQPRPYGADGRIRYVEQGKAEHMIVQASTETCHCTRRLRIDYTYRGQHGTVTVPPRDRPAFETTAWGRHAVQYDAWGAGVGQLTRTDCARHPGECRTSPDR